MNYLPQSEKPGPQPAARAVWADAETPTAIVPVPACTEHIVTELMKSLIGSPLCCRDFMRGKVEEKLTEYAIVIETSVA